MLDVSEVVNSSELAQEYDIQRSSGSWLNGVWVSVITNLQGYGVISVARPKDVIMTPQGDIIKADMVFHSTEPIYTTSQEQGCSSDILIWRGHKYRVLTVKPYSDYGYYRAIAVRMQAAG